MKAIKRYAALLLIFASLLVGSALLALEDIIGSFIFIAAGMIMTHVFDAKKLLPE
jgi:hypothetical protein